jgi:hypothetical protein
MSSGLDDALGGLLGQSGGSGAGGLQDLVAGTMGGKSGRGGGGLGSILSGLLGGRSRAGGGGGGGGMGAAGIAGVAALMPLAQRFVSSGGLSKLMQGFQANGNGNKRSTRGSRAARTRRSPHVTRAPSSATP